MNTHTHTHTLTHMHACTCAHTHYLHTHTTYTHTHTHTHTHVCTPMCHQLCITPTCSQCTLGCLKPVLVCGQMLGDMKFLDSLKEFDKEHIPSSIMKKIRERYISNPDYNPAIIKNVSSACEGLCKWVRAIDVYDEVNKVRALGLHSFSRGVIFCMFSCFWLSIPAPWQSLCIFLFSCHWWDPSRSVRESYMLRQPCAPEQTATTWSLCISLVPGCWWFPCRSVRRS